MLFEWKKIEDAKTKKKNVGTGTAGMYLLGIAEKIFMWHLFGQVSGFVKALTPASIKIDIKS